MTVMMMRARMTPIMAPMAVASSCLERFGGSGVKYPLPVHHFSSLSVSAELYTVKRMLYCFQIVRIGPIDIIIIIQERGKHTWNYRYE